MDRLFSLPALLYLRYNGIIQLRNCEVITLKKILKYLKGYEKQCVLGPLFKLLEATFELLIPLVVAKIVDTGISTGDRGYISKMCFVMILLGIIGLAMAVCAQYFSAVAAVGFSTRLRHIVLKHILGLATVRLISWVHQL